MADGQDGERGSASLEFVTAGLVLLVPLIYLVLAVAQLQGGILAVEGAARQAARVYVQAADAASGASAVDRAVQLGLADYGIDASTASVEVTCTPDPQQCLEPGSRVKVSVRAQVSLPLVPDVLDLADTASVPVGGTAMQTVSRFEIRR